MLRQLVAIFLITLVVSPFTAPFSTYELAVLNPMHQDADSLSSAKLVQDVAAIPCMGGSHVLVETIERLNLPSTSLAAPIPEARLLVLRL